jgi:hypothetical protein
LRARTLPRVIESGMAKGAFAQYASDCKATRKGRAIHRHTGSMDPLSRRAESQSLNGNDGPMSQPDELLAAKYSGNPPAEESS